jgi:integrase/recombinase XerD
MPGGRRSWTVLDDDGDVVECLRHWIVHLEQTHASPNTIRAYVRHVVDFASFLGANGAGIHEATVALYDSFLAWRLARRKDALPSPRLILLGVLGIFRPKTTKCSGGLSGRGLQRGITFP